MKKILVTGGTTFVSKYVAKYFVNAGYEVYVLNRKQNIPTIMAYSKPTLRKSLGM